MAKIDADPPEDTKTRVEHAKTEAALAQREVDTGFPVLHALATIALWSHLESLVRGLAAKWLKNKRSSWKVEPIKRLRIKLGEYRSIPREQKHAFVIELLERDLGAGLRNGVTRFEKLLEPFGLSGDVPENLRRTIYELGQVRNLLAHSAAKVDRQFVQACPWLDVRIGSDLRVSGAKFRTYHGAVMAYWLLLFCRVGEKHGVDMSEERLSLESMTKDTLFDTASKPLT